MPEHTEGAFQEVDAAMLVCEHHWVSRIYGGMSVRTCSQCSQPDWNHEREKHDAVEAVGAIRLALLGAANDKAAVALTRTILADIGVLDPKGTGSVKRLLRAFKRIKGRWVV